jgi:putative OPT family oligopeptide transporter
MSILRMFGNSNILENNIVQTIASAGGVISAVVFILPALVMIGFWKSFPFWETFLLCGVGATFGVMFTIPLRRALVVDSDLPFPEGVAAAETLKVGHKPASVEGESLGSPLAAISWGTGLSLF